MLSERIFYITERICDILNADNERNQILTLCQELSHDDRMGFLELHSDCIKREILENYSHDEIRNILEGFSLEDNGRKVIIKSYMFQANEDFGKRYYFPVEKIIHKLYMPSNIEEFNKMHRELSNDEKEEFLHKYNDCWRYKIIKYLEFHQKWFYKHDAGTLLEVITLLMEGKEVVVLSKDVKEGIVKLKEGLLRIYDYLRDVEAKYDDRQMLPEYELQFYHNLSNLAHSSDDFLGRVMSNDLIARDIDTLLETIHNFYSSNLSSTQLKLKFVVKDNINTTGGHQSVGNMKISINRSMPSKDKQQSRPKSYGHVPNPDLVGFDIEIQILLNHLIQPLVETKVVGIVGPGGSGKTTLAKHIYHLPQIKSRFAGKVWVCISQSWDKTTILNSIWRQATQKPRARKMGYEQLVECLSKLLSSMSYLVILDDIWSMDAWYDICSALPSRSGSKVVVTTRNKFLPQRIDPGVLIVEPKQLKDKECYELFKKRALLDENAHHDLLPLGKEMIKKCKGLPLAVVALAGVLGIDKRRSSWERVSKSVTDKMLNMANDSTQGAVKEILALSYYELDDNLKRCALYLHLFPEDHTIKAQQVIQMWIAERFMDEEYEAEGYLDELAQRSIVEVVETNHEGQVLEFRIHDLIRQMFINIDKERGILKNQELRVAPSKTLYGYGNKDFDFHVKVSDRNVFGNPHARSFIFLNFPCDIEVEQSFIKLKVLRVLILDNLQGLVEEIGNLIHLRYLELSGHTDHLPASIGNLENLLTLNLGGLDVGRVETIYLEKLKKLRHLYLPNDGRDYILRGVEKLKKLKTLWKVNAIKWRSSVMSKLSHVLQELSIVHIEEEVEEVFRTPSITSNNLHTLKLQWFWELRNMSILSKCTSLTKLVLWGKIKEGTTLMFPPNLLHLEMKFTYVEEKQLMNTISNSCRDLKFLFFRCAYKGAQIVCNGNSFPQLEELILIGPQPLIIERGAMPRLNLLIIDERSLLKLNEEGWERFSMTPQLFYPNSWKIAS